MFVAGWRHALRSEWPFIIIMCKAHCKPGKSGKSSLQLTHCVVHLPFPPPLRVSSPSPLTVSQSTRKGVRKQYRNYVHCSRQSSRDRYRTGRQAGRLPYMLTHLQHAAPPIVHSKLNTHPATPLLCLLGSMLLPNWGPCYCLTGVHATSNPKNSKNPKNPAPSQGHTICKYTNWVGMHGKIGDKNNYHKHLRMYLSKAQFYNLSRFRLGAWKLSFL